MTDHTEAVHVKKLKKAARLVRQARALAHPLPKPLYNDPNALAFPDQVEKDALLQQLARALSFTLKIARQAPDKESFKKKQNKIAHVLKKTLDELKECKEQLATLQAQCQGAVATLAQVDAERGQILADQWRLFEGLKRALVTMERLKNVKGLAIAKETEKVKQELAGQLSDAEKQQILLKSRLEKEKESQSYVKKSFEEILAKLKSECLVQIKAAEEKALSQEENAKGLLHANSDLKKQVALLKAHLEAALVDNKRLQQQIEAVRKNETEALQQRLQQLSATLEEKEAELTGLHRHLGKKLQDMAELQERLQQSEERLKLTDTQLSDQTTLVDVLKSEHMKEEARLNEELVQHKTQIDELRCEIERLRKVEEEWDRMASTINQLQQTLRPA